MVTDSVLVRVAHRVAEQPEEEGNGWSQESTKKKKNIYCTGYL